MRINHNIASLNTYRQLSGNTGATAKSLEKLSSGLRINRAGDDAAGLAISEKMRGQIRGLDQASRNSQDAISLIQTAEGALNETHSILQRMRELAVQSATDTNTGTDRSKIQSEVDQLAKEITRISNTTEFNTQNLLAGGLNDTFHVGANKDQNVSLSIQAMDAQTLGVAGANVTTSLTAGTVPVTVTTDSQSLNGTYVNVSKTLSTFSGASQSDALGGAGTFQSGANSYTGSTTKAFQVRIDSVASAAGDVNSASYTTDGGSTWTSAAVTDNAGTTDLALGDGIVFRIADDAQNTAADTYSFTANPQYLSVQIGNADTGGTTIGTAQKVYNNQSSVIVGDAASDRTATVGFDFATAFAAATANAYAASGGTFVAAESTTIAQSLVASTSATVGADGSVTTDAVVQKGINVASQGAANNSITTINTALETVSAERSKLGAMQNRLEHTIANLGTSSENLTASESRVRDVDMAKEMMEFTKNNILSQAAQSMLAQANQQPQGVLQLLR